MEDKKIVFLGTPEIAAIFLEGILKKGVNISLVVTKPDRVRERNNKVVESEVSIIAKKYNIDVFKPENINEDFSMIKDINPDLILTFAFGQILSSNVLSLSKYKPLNIHGSLLPKYRGASPIQQALKNGDDITGVSIIEMVPKMDAGPIYAKKEIMVEQKDNYTTLSEKVANCSILLFLGILDDYFNGRITPELQTESNASYCHYIKKDDLKLSLDEDVDTFINHVRYLSCVPGGYLSFNDGIVKIYAVDKCEEEIEGKVGQLIIRGKKLLLKLKNGVVYVKSLQFSGKKIISDSDYINGNKNREPLILL